MDILLVVLTFLSCFLFDISGIPAITNKLIQSYREQFRIMSDKSLDDQTKQQHLLRQIGKQLVLIGKLILGILLFIAPFLSLFVLERFFIQIQAAVLYSQRGILIPLLAVLAYILIKKVYGRIQQNR